MNHYPIVSEYFYQIYLKSDVKKKELHSIRLYVKHNENLDNEEEARKRISVLFPTSHTQKIELLKKEYQY
jgi:hypothetical protein